jgi:thiamine kinase-like enzyme
MPVVPCHNDLAPGNMIDDGERVWLVDFEFAAMNEASFDLANMALSYALRSDAVQMLTTTYEGSTTTPAAHSLARVRAWMLIATFSWVPWTAIQDHISMTGFDFAAWMQPRYQRAVSQLRGPAFERLLDDLTSG